MALFNLGLALSRISPTARAISTLRDAPVIRSNKPGMLTRPVGASYPYGIMWNPEYWAGAAYFRHHDLLLFNTGWMNIQIIPVKPRPERLHIVDDTYDIETMIPGKRLLKNDAAGRQTLSRVGFVLTMRVNTPVDQNPFALQEGGTTPASWAAGWTCLSKPDWEMCVPPGQSLEGAK